ncbi:MAG: hypothetical protein QXW23_06295 [Thermofilaceae archaeon]
MSSSFPRDLAQVILKIGGVLLLVLGFVDILRGMVLLIIFSHIGWFVRITLDRAFPILGFVGRFLTLLGPIIGIAHIVLGAVAFAVGYQLAKLAAPMPAPTRDRWLIIVAVLTALALIFLSPWYLLAFLLILLGLLLSPTLPPQPQIPQSVS